MTNPVKVWSYPARVLVRDGKPVCSHCGDDMVEVGDNQWMCPLGAAVNEYLAVGLAEMLDRTIDVSDRGSHGASGVQ